MAKVWFSMNDKRDMKASECAIFPETEQMSGRDAWRFAWRMARTHQPEGERWIGVHLAVNGRFLAVAVSKGSGVMNTNNDTWASRRFHETISERATLPRPIWKYRLAERYQHKTKAAS